MARSVMNIEKSEFSCEFVEKMKQRMVTSYFKYGPVAENYGKSRVDAIASLKKRLAKYEATGNTEWLVDVANFAMIEFMYPQHRKAHFRPTDSTESPGLEGVPKGEMTSE
jgi:hypothetical protein